MNKQKGHGFSARLGRTAAFAALKTGIAADVIGILGMAALAFFHAPAPVAVPVFVVLLLAATLVFVLLASQSGARAGRRLGENVAQLARTADSIAAGNLKVEIPAAVAEEAPELVASFQKIAETLRLLLKDVGGLVENAENGRLDARADASRYSGDYRAIVEGVNGILGATKKNLDDAFAFLGNLAEGVHQEPLGDDYPGYYGEFAENLNRVRSSFAVVAEETEKLAEAGRSGRLEVRGDASRVQGVYARMVQGVNDTFDAFKAPLDAAALFIAKMARGDKLEVLENPYQGYYARIIDNLNSVRASIEALLGESQKLARAGQEGDLSVRGDESAVNGSFAQVIGEFNRAFDAIAAPLQEADAVLGKMAVNDYTTAMSGDCKGMLLTLSDSINAVRGVLLGIELTFKQLASGDTGRLEELRTMGKKSENDTLLPACVATLQALSDLGGETGRLQEAARTGDLSVRGDEEKFQGGYRQLIGSVNEMFTSVAAPLAESSRVLQQLAEGDLTAEMAGEYQGEYNLVKTSLNGAVDAFNTAMSRIAASASQVSVGSKQVADGSQNLSQGSVEQASAVEELTSTVAEIAAQTKKNAENAAQASELSASAQTSAQQGNELMKKLLTAMKEISDASGNISKIIKTIDDIAFQTNILALNAAVEAARAGQYGKGFAVVAEEVRNLAGKSAEAAKETTSLIEGSLSKVGAGSKLVQDTAAKLDDIAQEVDRTAALVHDIAEAANRQASSVVQVDSGLEQVSTVVQTNSATAEQSAASSEELSGQADMLQQLVGGFRLKEIEAPQNA